MPLSAVQLKRIELIQDEKGNAFCDRFAAELLTKKTIADIASSGKIPLAESKREKVLSYVVSALADVGGAVVPTGTLAKVANDLVGFLVHSKRKQRQELFSKVQANPVHFTLVVLGLTNALLITYGDQLWTKLPVDKALDVGKQGEKLAKHMVGLIKYQKALPNDGGDKSLAALVKGFYELFQQQVLPTKYQPGSIAEFSDNAFAFEDILLIAAAQLLGLPLNYFEKTQEWESQLEELKKKVDEFKKTATQEERREKALIQFGEGARFGKGAEFSAEDIGTQQQIHGSLEQLAKAKELRLKLGTFWGKPSSEETREKEVTGKEKQALQTLIDFGPNFSAEENAKVTATKAKVQQRLVLT